MAESEPNREDVLRRLPRIEDLPSDPEWEATEAKIARYCIRHVPPFEE